ncbi:XRE family transcriptional regulator [Streptomyces sp. NBC_01799]|uniref:helix-turn-helix domain-containing protein n=1 Tax=Streptomyces sp. NBC_01800 TaxID=2975945 RepID=UPI002DDA3267|nr:XRE family transcriptional regulator [Streptomyces sp. NBC_01800]WSA72854.1 XRE family transcriptional regulator [Streptomyces sp. NBC_01800]WSA81381.1 XRE family transcriptional regulator [Streptomyces sp. NBC_01799]
MGLNDEVGRRVKRLRQDGGLSLSELSRRSGVGKGTLSELESGRRNPTLETLYALTTALGRPLSAVLDDPAPGVVGGGVSGSAVTAVLLERYEDEGAATDVFRVTIAEGATQESAAHVPHTTESLMVLSGTAVVGLPDAPQTAGPGGHAHWPADAPHFYSAPDGEVQGVLFVRYPKGASSKDASLEGA